MSRSMVAGGPLVALSALLVVATATGAAGVVDPDCTETTTVSFDVVVPDGPSQLSIFNYRFYDEDGFLEPLALDGSEFSVTGADGVVQTASTEAGLAWQDHPVAPGENRIVQSVLPALRPGPPPRAYWPVGVHSPQDLADYDPGDPFVLTVDVGPWQTCQAWVNNTETFVLGRAATAEGAAPQAAAEFPDWDTPGWVHSDGRPVTYAYRCDALERPADFGAATVTVPAGLTLAGVQVRGLVDGAPTGAPVDVPTGPLDGSTAPVDLSALDPGEYRLTATVRYSLQGRYEVAVTTTFLDTLTQTATVSVDEDVPCSSPSPSPDPTTPAPTSPAPTTPGTPSPDVTSGPTGAQPGGDHALAATGGNVLPLVLAAGALVLVGGVSVLVRGRRGRGN